MRRGGGRCAEVTGRRRCRRGGHCGRDVEVAGRDGGRRDARVARRHGRRCVEVRASHSGRHREVLRRGRRTDTGRERQAVARRVRGLIVESVADAVVTVGGGRCAGVADLAVAAAGDRSGILAGVRRVVGPLGHLQLLHLRLRLRGILLEL